MELKASEDSSYDGKVLSLRDSTPLYTRMRVHQIPDNPKVKKTFFVTHGAVEYHKRHLALFNYLIEHSTESFRMVWIDLRGHGLSSGARSHVESFECFCFDLVSVYNFWHNRLPDDESFILLGHSMGGLVVLETVLKKMNLFKRRPTGLILSNPCIKVGQDLNLWKKEGLGLGKKFLKLLRIPTIYRGEHLTHCEDSQREFDTDPLISKFMTLNLIGEIVAAGDHVRKLSYFLDLPIIFLLAGQDELVSAETTELFAKGIDQRLVTLQKYPDMRHELFNEVENELVFKDVKAWIDLLDQETDI